MGNIQVDERFPEGKMECCLAYERALGCALSDEITLPNNETTNTKKLKLWPNGTIGIPLLIEDEIKNSFTLHNNVLSAINEFHSKTVIKFRQISQDDVIKFPDHIVISYSTDITASANVGMSVFGGPHIIWLQDWVHPGGVMHELMHILGFVHEHQRPDRHLFVEVNSKQADDIIYEDAYCIGKYDPESVMHYKWDVFIKPKKGGLLTEEQIQKLHNFPKSLSKGDIHGINFAYGGERKCTFDEDQRDYVSQAFYECKTCWGEDSSAGCCVSCRFSCHDNHEVVYHQPEIGGFFCDCGQNNHILKCTKASTQGTPCEQPAYSCSARPTTFFCYPCSMRLGHNSDDRIVLGKKTFECMCSCNI